MSDLRGKRIFLTGGTGFFGKSILSMLRRGYLPETDFVILSRNPAHFLAGNPEFSGMKTVRFVEGDVRNFTFSDGSFDAVIHAAAPAVTTLAQGEMHALILAGTRRVIEFAGACGAKKLMMISSGAVYGPQPSGMGRMAETTPCHPVNEYGEAKLEAERMCCESGINTVLPRCFSFTGPYLNRNIHFAIGNFIRDALAGNEIIIQGDGMPLRSYLYADDLVEWLFRILECGRSGEAYNVGSDEAVSIADLARRVKRLLGSSGEVLIQGEKQSQLGANRYIPDIGRAQKELNLQVRTSLDEAILRSAGQTQQ